MMMSDTLAGAIQQAVGFFEQAISIWVSGGWAMPAIAAIALITFGLGVHVKLQLRRKDVRSVPEKTWRRWILHPAERKGRLGEILDFVTRGGTIQDAALHFRQLRTTETAPLERDLRVMRICVTSAPLLGLLGTVTGMLSTFDALATGAGGDKTMGLVAKGISEALITTETGLVVALPGIFFQYHLARGFEKYKAFLSHLEVACSQAIHRSRQGMKAAS
jgi:biopolymer transport protein ExbB